MDLWTANMNVDLRGSVRSSGHDTLDEFDTAFGEGLQAKASISLRKLMSNDCINYHEGGELG